MTWRVFGMAVILLGAATLLASRSELVRAEGGGYPRAKPYLKVLLDDAHKRFRKDAVIAKIELQGAAGQAWIGVGLYSPSNGAILSVQVGGPNNGAFRVSQTARQTGAGAVGLPLDFNIDLPEAVATLRKRGFTGPLGPVYLGMVGASGTQPLLAWTVRVYGGPIMVPLYIDAQDGKFIAWQRAMDPPNGSDAQLKAIWDALLNRNKPADPDIRNNPVYRALECSELIQAGLGC
jgi:hypothetical protein